MKTEDILKHYGVKGMKWEHKKEDYDAETEAIKEKMAANKRAFEDIQNAHTNIEKNLNKTGADLENVSKILHPKKTIAQELGNLKDSVKNKIGAVSKDIKKKGLKLIGPILYANKMAKLAEPLKKQK